MIARCLLCRGERLSLVREPRWIEAEDGTSLPFVDELTECLTCGERYYTHEQSMASSRALAAALRSHEHLLTPDEIRAIRARFRLSQAGLEKLLCLGAKTVVRWEGGAVCQSRAADTLLRFLDFFGPAVFESVRQSRISGKSKALPSPVVAEPRASYRAGRRPRRRK